MKSQLEVLLAVLGAEIEAQELKPIEGMYYRPSKHLIKSAKEELDGLIKNQRNNNERFDPPN